MGDPMELEIHGYELTLRLADAENIEVRMLNPEELQPAKEITPAHANHPGLGEGGKFHSRKDENPLPEGTVHAKQGFRYLKPLHWGDTVTLRGFVKSKMEKKGLKFIERQVEVYDAANDLAVVSEIKIILPE